MVPEGEKIVGHSTDWWSAVGTVVNAVVVVALAIINFLYLRAANRQATAAEKQTEEIKKQIALSGTQTDLSREQNALMQCALLQSDRQYTNQRRGSLIQAESELRKIKSKLTEVDELLRGQTNLNFQENCIFPDTWDVIARCIEQEIAGGASAARELQGALMDTKSELFEYRERRRSQMAAETEKQLRDSVRGKVRGSTDKLDSIIQLLQKALDALLPQTAANHRETRADSPE